ncbi:MAG TPA: tetratricopeptide repeat protein, partial [Blastocatellia bacterium]
EFEIAIAQREGTGTQSRGTGRVGITTMGFGLEDDTRPIGDAGTRTLSADEMQALMNAPGTADLGSPGGTLSLGAPPQNGSPSGTTQKISAPSINPPPSFPEAHVDLGRVLYDLGQGQDAIAEFRKAIEQRTGLFPRAHYELGRALIRAGRTNEAMAELHKAIEQQGGTFPEAYFQIGQLQARQGDKDAAIDAYQLAIEQSGGVYPEAYYQLGLTHVRSRNNEAAVQAYRTAIEQRGGFYPEAHQDLGRVLYSLGNLEAANEEYSIAVRQRNPRLADEQPGGQVASSAGPQSSRQEAVTEVLEAGLRQAPAAADASKVAATTATLASDVLPDDMGLATDALRPAAGEGD